MYSLSSRVLHWVMAGLIVAAFTLIWTRETLPKGDLKNAMLDWHESVGLLVLLLLAIRLLARFLSPAPPLDRTPLWQRLAARAVEGALYVAMLVQPLIGWLFTSYRGGKPALFGLQLPALAPPDRTTAHRVGDVHEFVGWVIVALVALHLLAALYHHFWLGDDVLVSMLRGRRRAAHSPAGALPRRGQASGAAD